MLTRIVADDAMAARLAGAGRNLDTVPARGETVQLRDTANPSTGGTAVDRTDDIHHLNRLIAEQAAATVGLEVCGIDFLSPDISLPVSAHGGCMYQINAAPGLRITLQLSSVPLPDILDP